MVMVNITQHDREQVAKDLHHFVLERGRSEDYVRQCAEYVRSGKLDG